MRRITLTARTLGMGLALSMAALSPLAVSAQSDLDTSEAQAFIGNWDIAISSEFGDFTMVLEIEDQSGKVAAAIGVPEMGGPMQDITEIARTGEGLTMVWEMDAQGQYVDAMMIVSLEGESMQSLLTIADGQFTAAGVGTRSGG